MPPSAQPAAQEAPTSSVPTRIATATSVETCSQLTGRGSGGDFRSGLAMRECLAGEPPARKSILGGRRYGISSRLILLALLRLQRVLDVGDRAVHLTDVLGPVRLGGAACKDRAGVFHHLDVVFVGGASSRGNRRTATALLQIAQRFLEGAVDRRHVLGALRRLDDAGGCLLHEHDAKDSAEKTRTRHEPLRHSPITPSVAAKLRQCEMSQGENFVSPNSVP